VNTTRNEAGDVYKPRRLLSGPDVSFKQLMSSGTYTQPPAGVQVLGLETLSGDVRQVHEPDHPHANADGFVSYPDINHASEMTMMIKTSRAYEANLTAISIAQQMYSRALDMGRG